VRYAGRSGDERPAKDWSQKTGYHGEGRRPSLTPPPRKAGRGRGASPGARRGEFGCALSLMSIAASSPAGTFVSAKASYVVNARPPDPEEFEKLVSLHYEGLYRFAMSLTRSESEAGDLVQETFLTWANKGRQMADVSRAKGWLFTTLHRHFLQRQRKLVRFPEVELGSAEEMLPAVAPTVVTRLESEELLEMLRRIDPLFRAALALFYLEDRSYAEIASILEVPMGTVKSRIARGLAQLKRALTESQTAPGTPAAREGGNA
jgi:RNA polymerase sigma-70 factor, ECF subfamily